LGFYLPTRSFSWVFGLLLFMYSANTLSIWPSLSGTDQLTLLQPHTNVLLLNTLNRYHPLCLYAAFALVVSYGFLYQQAYLRRSTTNLLKFLTTYGYYLSGHITSTSLTALIGGSWWALQEGTWGGWWNWDASEVLGLTPLMFLIWRYHEPISFPLTFKGAKRSQLATVLIVFTYSIIQLNFENASHNFGIQSFFFFQNTIFFINCCSVASMLYLHQTTHLFRGSGLVWLNRDNAGLGYNLPTWLTWLLYRLSTLTAGLAPGCIILVTILTVISPKLPLPGAELFVFFFKLNLLMSVFLLSFYNYSRIFYWGGLFGLQLIYLWQVVFAWVTYGRYFKTPHLLHTLFLVFFILNTKMGDLLTIGRQGGAGGTLSTHLFESIFTDLSWTLQGELIATTVYLTVPTWGGFVLSTTMGFQATTPNPSRYFLLTSNLAQSNLYLLTDSTRSLFLEIETTYLALSLLVALLWVILYLLYVRR